MTKPLAPDDGERAQEKVIFPRRIYVLCVLSILSCLVYTILIMKYYDRPPIQAWIESSRPTVEIVSSMTFTRTKIFERENAPVLGDEFEPIIHIYAYLWIIGLSYFVLLVMTSTSNLRDYYVEVTLRSYPKSKPIIDHIAWKWIGIIGCWAAAAYGGELSNIYTRTAFICLAIPGFYYFALAFLAALLAHFRFQKRKSRNLSPQEQGNNR